MTPEANPTPQADPAVAAGPPADGDPTPQADPPAQGDQTRAYLDGNALAGPLREIFAVDVTVASGRCVGCGEVNPVAALRVYPHAPGLVGRCPSCDVVMLRVVRGSDRAWLDLRGFSALQIPLA
jgi:hypothetical protein